MQIQRELFEDILVELPELWRQHYEEIADDKDKKRLAPDVFRYINYERSGQLVVFTARDKGRLVGYAFFVLQMALHYKHHGMAANDLFFVLPEHRGKFTGSRLIDASEQELRRIGVQEIQMRTKTKHDFGRLLERKGFKETEIVYRKYVGGGNG